MKKKNIYIWRKINIFTTHDLSKTTLFLAWLLSYTLKKKLNFRNITLQHAWNLSKTTPLPGWNCCNVTLLIKKNFFLETTTKLCWKLSKLEWHYPNLWGKRKKRKRKKECNPIPCLKFELNHYYSSSEITVSSFTFLS